MTDRFEVALADCRRPRRDLSRDKRDNTIGLLRFAAIDAGDVIVDFLPFRGYFTHLFSSIVGDSGHVYAAVPEHLTSIERIARGKAEIAASLTPHSNISLISGPAELAGSPPKPADVFWISQNYHDLHDKFMGPVDIAKFNSSVFETLKPGGRYIIVDHAALTGSPGNVTETLHRIEEAEVIREVEAAGFSYEERSDVLANDHDPHTRGIFSRGLRYHTDRFVLKFVKAR
jgi:predicted methyltransferase